jgi:homoserine kinase type II
VPRTIHDRSGAGWRELDGKALALIEFLPGISVDRPTPGQARVVGAALAQAHLAAQDFPLRRANALGPRETAASLARCGPEALGAIHPALPATIAHAEQVQDAWPRNLPRSVCHTDLFPDNVLLLGERVGGMIDFYFACDEAMAYDLAVTHAAWSFDKRGTRYSSSVGDALIEGYQSVRALAQAERAARPLLAQGACLRFIASRAEDWLDTPADALVTRKDPMDFVKRLQFYAEAGEGAFRP